jgi:hypothetical protein
LKESSSRIIVQVWGKLDSSANATVFSKRFWVEETDHFLGLVSLSVEEIAARGPVPWEAWFPLQKRSKKSTVSGEIYMSIQNLPPDTAAAEKMASEKPVVPHCQLFKYLLRGKTTNKPLLVCKQTTHAPCC